MALTKDKKQSTVTEVADSLGESKLTVISTYEGSTVKDMQKLRSDALENGTTVKVVKNRLVVKALEKDDKYKSIDRGLLVGMLMYAFNPTDEVSSAKDIYNFSKLHPKSQIIGAITHSGEFISADDTKALALLPTKDQLRGQLVGVLQAPFGGFVSVVSGNLRGFMQVLTAKAESIS